MHKNGLVMKDACDRDKWREVMKSMTIRNPANSVNGEETGSKLNRWWSWEKMCVCALPSFYRGMEAFYFKIKKIEALDLDILNTTLLAV